MMLYYFTTEYLNVGYDKNGESVCDFIADFVLDMILASNSKNDFLNRIEKAFVSIPKVVDALDDDAINECYIYWCKVGVIKPKDCKDNIELKREYIANSYMISLDKEFLKYYITNKL